MRRDRTTTRAAITATATAALALTVGGATAGTAVADEASGGSNTCAYTTARPTIRLGDTGPAVEQAQCYLLNILIIDDIIEVNGDFDAKTELRVGQFQNCAGLPSDGVVDPATWSVLEQYMDIGRTC